MNPEESIVDVSTTSDAFNAAALTALGEMFQLDGVVLTDVRGLAIESAVVASIGLEGKSVGKLSVITSAEAAANLTERYLPGEATITDEIVNDMVGEIANVIAGQAKTILKSTRHHFMLTTPTVVCVSSVELKLDESDVAMMIVKTKVGEIALIVRPNQTNDDAVVVAHRRR